MSATEASVMVRAMLLLLELEAQESIALGTSFSDRSRMT